MTAGKYCNREVIITAPDTTVIEAARLMRHYHVGDLVVVESGNGNQPIGIVTDRDLVVEVLAQEVPPDSVTVRDIMSTHLSTVNEDSTLMDSLQQMRSRGIRRLVVINKQGMLEGILCADDIIELISEASNELVISFRQERSREVKEHA